MQTATRGFNSIPLITLLAVAATLYFAREVLIPLAIALLFAFVLAPVSRRLEKAGLGRIPATVVAVTLFTALIGSIAWVAGQQSLQVAVSLPVYKENIQAKLKALRQPQDSAIVRASEAIEDLEVELVGPPVGGVRKPAARTPMEVVVREPEVRVLESLREVAHPLLGPLASAGAVLIFTVLMLLKREDLRDRLIRLAGLRQISVTTQAMGDAAQRVSRYLGAQIGINLCYGLAVGVALHFIGIPNATLWGLLAGLLRFIPYVGVWIGAALPLALAFAIGEGWAMVAWTAMVFLVLEIAACYVLEPWVYGSTTGLSPVAIMVAAVFWTWLWGATGLLLATPLTVCLVVMGRYVPQLEFLEIVLGDSPVLKPAARYYQRLLAGDEDEATELAEARLAEAPLLELFDGVLLPALRMAEGDRQQGVLDEARARFVVDCTRRIVEDLPETPAAAPASAAGEPAGLVIVGASDEADELAGLMLKQLMPAAAWSVTIEPATRLRGVRATVLGRDTRLVLISAVPPFAAAKLTRLARQLRARFPDVRIVAGFWQGERELAKTRERLATAGVEVVVTTLAQALAELHALRPAVPAPAHSLASSISRIRRRSTPRLSST